MSAKIIFKKGSYDEFKKNILGIQENGAQKTPNIEVGALYLTEDEGGLYLGREYTDENNVVKKEAKRIGGGVLFFDTLQEFQKNVAPPYSTNVLYYINDQNALCKWTGQAWKVLYDDQLLTSLQNSITQNASDIAKNASDIAKNTSDIASINQDLEDLADQWGSVIQEIAGLIDTNKQNIEAVGARVTALEGQHSSLDKRIETIEGAYATKETVANVNERVNEASNKISALTGKVDGINTSVNNLSAQLDNTDEKVLKLETHKSTYESKVNTIESNYLKKDGSVAMTGSLDLGNNKITKVADPGNDNTAAANKAYVDAAVQNMSGSLGGVVDRVAALESHKTTYESKVNTIESNYLKKDGSVAMTGDLDVGSNKITKVADPGNDTTAATNKAYVDTAVQNVSNSVSGATDRITALETHKTTYESKVNTIESNYLKKDGTVTMTGSLNLGGKTITNVAGPGSDKTAAVNKDYVDTAVQNVNATFNNYLKKDGSVTMTGSLNLGNKTITNVAAPGDDGTAATNKTYVDTAIAASMKAVDAMTFKGTLGASGNTTTTLAGKLPSTKGSTYVSTDSSIKGTKPQNGDTFKVAETVEYLTGKTARAGDLIINNGQDDEAPNWVHIQSGYDAATLQKLILTNGTIYLTDGLTENSSSLGGVTISSDCPNLSISSSMDSTSKITTVKLDMIWDKF